MMRMMRKLKTMTVSKIDNNNDDADDFGEGDDEGEEDLKVVELWWHLDTDMSDKVVPLSNIDWTHGNDDSGL